MEGRKLTYPGSAILQNKPAAIIKRQTQFVSAGTMT